MIKRYLSLTLILFVLAIIFTLWLSPSVTLVIGIGFFLVCLTVAVSAIFKKYEQSKNPSLKIVKEILVLIVTALLSIFLGGLAGMYANQYTAQRFGVIVGIFSALAVSFAAGYLVRWGMAKVVK